jgi:enoyl-[acyl-carrier-protein] reductase (NADH)
MHPSKKVISPEEIAETAKFLCSEGAREIRGAEILHDAGANA